MNSKCILHVDDSWETRRLVRAVLTYHGYQVVEAEDGTQSVQMALTADPDLILMDLHLPDFDGVEATRRIRRSQAARQVPIIALTATERGLDYERLMASGCDDYLQKPFSPVRLTEIVRQYTDTPYVANISVPWSE